MWIFLLTFALLAMLAFACYSFWTAETTLEKVIWAILAIFTLSAFLIVLYKWFKKSKKKLKFRTKRSHSFGNKRKSDEISYSDHSDHSNHSDHSDHSEIPASVEVLYMCATDETAELNPPKFTRMIQSLFENQPELFAHFVGMQITKVSATTCNARAADPNLVEKCGYKEGMFDVVVLEHCPIRFIDSDNDVDDVYDSVLRSPQTLTNVREVLTDAGLMIIPMAPTFKPDAITEIVKACEDGGMRQVDIIRTQKRFGLDMYIFEKV